VIHLVGTVETAADSLEPYRRAVAVVYEPVPDEPPGSSIS